MRKTKSQLRTGQIAKLQAEQEAYDRSVKEPVKAAALARCSAVEELHEVLGVKPEPAMTREGKNTPVQVSTDKDETKRSARLLEAAARILAERDEHSVALQQQRQAASEQSSASAVPGHSSIPVPTS